MTFYDLKWPKNSTQVFGTEYYSCVWLMYQTNNSFIQILCVPMSAHVVLLNKLWTNTNKIILKIQPKIIILKIEKKF